MKTLAEFLANHLLDHRDFDDLEWPDILKDYTQTIAMGIIRYKEHLQTDSPNTVQWAMIERQMILALERMQSHEHLNGASHSNTNIENTKYHCLQPAALKTDLGCIKCTSLLACHNNENRRCSECLLFDLTARGNCKQTGYGTLATNHACDRFKLKVSDDACLFPAARAKFGCDDCRLHQTCEIQNVRHPICPINIYFEGDENKCNEKDCDWDTNTRSCSTACKIITEKIKCISVNVPRVHCEFPESRSKQTNCENCSLK